jgi:hypothetical protein
VAPVKSSLPPSSVPIEEPGKTEELGKTEPDFVIKSPALLNILHVFGKKGDDTLPRKPEAPVVPVGRTAKSLPNPNAEAYYAAYYNILEHNLGRWSINKHYSPEQITVLDELGQIFSKTLHVSLLKEDAYALKTMDIDTIVATIRKLRNKVGTAELAVMMLIAKITEEKMYERLGYKSHSEFFRQHAESMGISISRAWDYYRRGKAFFNYGKDIINGTGAFTGMSIEEFIASHMSKLTLLERTVKKFGKKEALINLRMLTFREFQKTLSEKKSLDDKASNSPCKQVSIKDSPSQEPLSLHESQKVAISSLNLKPNEKRLLRIIAKGGKYCLTEGLTDEQVAIVETRLRQYRQDVYERNLQVASLSYERPPFDPNRPFEFSADLLSLNNINDIILCIRSGLALAVPTRRAIAFLVYRLYSEVVDGIPQWKRPYEGVKYTSFKDFAFTVLGLGEDYRDYLAVGKVLKEHFHFLEGLSDMDTEDVFFKLRYLLAALKTHQGDEFLVLARLRSLTIREFKLFSEDTDFEITFSKKLTEKKLEIFNQALYRTRAPFGAIGNTSVDFIEVYHSSEKGIVMNIVSEVLADEKNKEAESVISTSPEVEKPEPTGSSDDGIDKSDHPMDADPLLTSPAA